MVVLFLTYWGTSILFFKVAAQIYIPTKVHKSTLFSMSLPTLVISYLLIIAILTCMRWHLIALFFPDNKWYWALFHVPVGQLHVFLEKCLNLLPGFLIKLFFFCYWIPSSSLHTSYNCSEISFSISQNICFCIK